MATTSASRSGSPRAIAIEPEYSAAHGVIAFYLRGGLVEEDRLAALHHARIALAPGDDDATALALAAFIVDIFEPDYETAFNAFATPRLYAMRRSALPGRQWGQ
jgi:hypothetical protein